MTVTELIESLSAEICAATENLKLPVEYQNQKQRRLAETWRRVNVYEQYIPKDLFQTENYYPCAVVELLGIHDDLKLGSTAEIGLSLGVFAKESDGWKDAFHLTELIRHRLLTRRVLAKRFRLTGEIHWETAQNQPEPFFFVYATLSYENFLPQEELIL